MIFMCSLLCIQLPPKGHVNFPKSVPPLVLHSHLYFVMGQLVQSSSQKSIWWFVNFLHILLHTACSLHHHHMPLSTGDEFRRGKYISPINIELHREFLHGIKFPESLPLHINVYHEQHLADWQNDRLTDWLLWYLLHITPSTCATF